MNKKTYILFTIICCIYGCGGGGEATSAGGGSNVVSGPNALSGGIGGNGNFAQRSPGQTVGEGGSGKIATGPTSPTDGVGENGTGNTSTASSTGAASTKTNTGTSSTTANSPGTAGEGGSGYRANGINTLFQFLPCSNSGPQSLLLLPSSNDSNSSSVVALPGSNETVGVITNVNQDWIEINGVQFSTESVAVTNGFGDIYNLTELKAGMTVKEKPGRMIANNSSNARIITMMPSVRGRVRSFDGSTMTLDIANKQISITQQTRCEANDPTESVSMGEFVEIYGYEIQSTNKTLASLVVKIPDGPSSNKPYEIFGKLTSVDVINNVASINGLSFSFASVSSIRQGAAVDGAWVRIASELSSEQSNPWIIEKIANQNLILTISSP